MIDFIADEDCVIIIQTFDLIRKGFAYHDALIYKTVVLLNVKNHQYNNTKINHYSFDEIKELIALLSSQNKKDSIISLTSNRFYELFQLYKNNKFIFLLDKTISRFKYYYDLEMDYFLSTEKFLKICISDFLLFDYHAFSNISLSILDFPQCLYECCATKRINDIYSLFDSALSDLVCNTKDSNGLSEMISFVNALNNKYSSLVRTNSNSSIDYYILYGQIENDKKSKELNVVEKERLEEAEKSNLIITNSDNCIDSDTCDGQLTAEYNKDGILNISQAEMFEENDKCFKDYLNIDLTSIANKKLVVYPLLNRTKNVLLSLKVFDVYGFLNLKKTDLIHAKSSGKKTLIDAFNLLEEIKKDNKESRKHEVLNDEMQNNYFIEDDNSLFELIPEANKIVSCINKTDTIKAILKDRSFKDFLNFDYLLIEDKPISSFSLLVRTQNIFTSLNVKTLFNFLELKVVDLIEYKGSGKKTIIDALNILKELTLDYNKMIDLSMKKSNQANEIKRKNRIIVENKDKIKVGDFSFVSNYEKEIEIDTINSIKNSYSFLEPEFVRDILDKTIDKDLIYNQICSLTFESSLLAEINALIKKVPINRKNKTIDYCMLCYDVDDNIKNIILSKFESEKSLITEIVVQKIQSEEEYIIICDFYDWLCSDLASLLNAYFDKLNDLSERQVAILSERADGVTLEQVGVKYSVSRERIRQIESKAMKRLIFGSLNRERISGIVSILVLDLGSIISIPDLLSIIKDNGGIFALILKAIENIPLVYDSELETFFYKDSKEVLNKKIDSLPTIITLNKLDELAQLTFIEDGIPISTFKLAINKYYKNNKGVYTKDRDPTRIIYYDVIEKYFPNGLRIYNEDDMALFRMYVEKDYYGYTISSNNRAIQGRISDLCLLIDKGTYYIKRDYYFNSKLINSIRDYVKKYAHPFLFVRILFEEFEEELKTEGINNKYHFQGALREVFDNEFNISKDYISTEHADIQVQNTIVEVIKANSFPMSKKELAEKLPYASSLSIMFAANNPNIISYSGEYMHIDNIEIYPNEISIIKKELYSQLSDNKPHSARDTYFLIQNKYPEVLSRNCVKNYYSFFSLFEYLFQDSFNFDRPFISLPNVECRTIGSWLNSYYHKNKISFDELSFFKNNVLLMRTQSLLLIANACNDYYFICNEGLISIEYSGITQKNVREIEDLIHIQNESKPVSSFINMGMKFPIVSVKWDEMLLYSALLKWSSKYILSLSSNDLQTAHPWIKIKDETSFDNFECQDFEEDMKKESLIDDLVDMDDSILDEILGE